MTASTEPSRESLRPCDDDDNIVDNVDNYNDDNDSYCGSHYSNSLTSNLSILIFSLEKFLAEGLPSNPSIVVNGESTQTNVTLYFSV